MSAAVANAPLANAANTIKSVTNNVANTLGNMSIAGFKISDIITGYDGVTTVMILIMVFLFLIIFGWCYTKLRLDQTNCSDLSDLYPNFPQLSNIDPTLPAFKYNLRDYYIKSAYNCCSAGRFKNDFVNTCALKNCIYQGARCLDFEIYSVDSKPVVAVSTTDDYSVKESYNSIPFASAMEIVALNAFNGSACPNPKDPLILHLRIKSQIKSIHDDIARALYNTLNDRLLGKKYSYENYGENIGSESLKDLMEKVVIVVDKSNPRFSDTLLNEYVNLTSNSVFMRSLRYNDILYTPDKDEQIEYNRRNMSIVLPKLSAANDNFSSALAFAYGCQMSAMSFQNFDANLEFYTQYFDNAGTAFVLRPDNLRYIETIITAPENQNPGTTLQQQSYTDPTSQRTTTL